MFSSGWAVTARLSRRTTAMLRRGLVWIAPSGPCTLTRTLPGGSARVAAKVPAAVLWMVMTGTHAPSCSRSTATGTAAAGATRPLRVARRPRNTREGAWNAATCRPAGAAAGAGAGAAGGSAAAARAGTESAASTTAGIATR